MAKAGMIQHFLCQNHNLEVSRLFKMKNRKVCTDKAEVALEVEDLFSISGVRGCKISIAGIFGLVRSNP
jgi:hypothetical protein